MQLALPSRDYYLKASSEGDMEAYHTYMTNVAVLLGANKATASRELKLVVELEKKLANVSDRVGRSSLTEPYRSGNWILRKLFRKR